MFASKRPFVTAMTAMAFYGLFSGNAMATSVNFSRLSSSGITDNGTVTISFKITGLGNVSTVTVTATANATANYACQNNSGGFPNDPKKEKDTGTVTASGTFNTQKNGSAQGSLLLQPPTTTLSCPGGQRPVLVSVDYGTVSLTTNLGGSASIFIGSRTFFNI